MTVTLTNAYYAYMTKNGYLIDAEIQGGGTIQINVPDDAIVLSDEVQDALQNPALAESLKGEKRSEYNRAVDAQLKTMSATSGGPMNVDLPPSPNRIKESK